MRTVGALLLLTLACDFSRADEPPKPVAPPAAPPPASKAAETPPTPEEAADAVLAAVAAKDTPALKALAAREEPDPWIVADELLRRGEFLAADALAGAEPGPGVHALAAYVAAQRAHPVEPAARDALRDGMAAAKAGDFAGALATLDRAPSPGADVPGARRLEARGQVLIQLRQPVEGAKSLARAAEVGESIGWLRRARLWAALAGRAASGAGTLDLALTCFRRAHALAERIGDVTTRASATINVGGCLTQMGNWREGVGWIRRGVDLTRTRDDVARDKLLAFRFIGLRMLAQVYDQTRALAMAISVCEEAADLAPLVGRSDEEAGFRFLAAGYQLRLELPQAAAGNFERAAASFAAKGNVESALEARKGLGAAWGDLGRNDEAVEVLKSVVEALRATADADPRAVASSLGELALSQAAAGHPEEARVSFDDALRRAAAAQDEGDTLTWLRLQLGTFLVGEGKHAEALPLVRAAADHALALGNENKGRHALAWVARALLGLGRPAEAVAAARQGVSVAVSRLSGLADEESSHARQSVSNLVEVGLSAALAANDVEAAVFFAESGRGMAFLEMLGARRKEAVAAVPAALRAEATAAQAEVTQARLALQAAVRSGDLPQSRQARARLLAAEEAWAAARTRIERISKIAAEATFPEPATASEIAATLAVGDAFVLYAPTLEGLCAVLIERDRPPRVVALGASAGLEEAVDVILSAKAKTDVAPSVATLRDRTIAPLGLARDVRRLVISPYSVLSYAPFALLAPALDVVFAPSGTVLRALGTGRTARGSAVLAIGNPDYARQRPSLAPLPATADEVAAVAPRDDDVRLLEGRATEEGFRRAVATRPRWRSVHFACHGLVNAERPALSALALTPDGIDDGLLTAGEIGESDIPADLVALSACETAKGLLYHAEGIVGLTRSFMLAGAPQVMCSLWKVDDEATRALMTKFYELWNPKDGRPGLATAEALRKAQEFVKSQERWAHPYFWAAWVLWGVPE